MSAVPPELIREILIRLPAEQLLRFRCVEKEWRRIIDCPDFIRSHLDRQSGAEDVLMIETINHKLYSLSLESLTHPDSSVNIVPVRIRNLPQEIHFRGLSCHGLILTTYPRTWLVCNPFSGHWLELPYEKFFGRTAGLGLGYDSFMNDYKVVRVSRYGKRKTSIYSLKSNKWHMIQDLPSCSAPVYFPGVFVDGALHWIAYAKEVEERNIKCIIALDLNKETYRKLPMPPLTPEQNRCRLYASAGCLLVSCYDGTNIRLECIWILKDVWTKLISFEKTVDHAEFVSYMKNKEQVLLWRIDGFLLFDLGATTIGKQINIRIRNIISRQVLPASLVQLNESDNEADASKQTRKRKRRVGNNKLEAGVRHFLEL